MEMFGGLYFMTMNAFMGNFFNAILLFQAERPVFLREQANKMYRVLPYYISKLIVDTPVMLVTPMLATLIIYWSIGLASTVEQFFGAYLIQVMCALAASSFGYLLSSIFENETAATSLAPLFIMPMMLFGGLFTNNAEAPGWLGWIQYISPIKYCAEGLMRNEFKFDERGIRDNLLSFLGYNMTYWDCFYVFLAIILVCRIVAFFTFSALVRKF